jgi:hypothetical protein
MKIPKEVKQTGATFCLVALASLTSFAPAWGDEPATPVIKGGVSGSVLFGRIEDFKSPAGPSFPTLNGSASTQVLEGKASDNELPSDIRGVWHGEIAVTSCRTTDACDAWDASFAHTWNLQKDRKGPGIFTFTRKGGGTKLASAHCIFNIPVRETEITYRRIIGGFANPTDDEIHAINLIIKPLRTAMVVHLAGKSEHEVLESGVPNEMNSESKSQKRLSENVWQNDSISKRTFFYDPPKGKQIIYAESVSTITKRSDDVLYFQSAEARYNANKEPLCYSVLEGELSKGAIEMPDHRDVSVDLLPVEGGVSIKGTGAFGTSCSGEIAGARLKPNNFQFGY